MGVKKIAETLTEADLVTEVSRVITEVTGVQLGAKQVPLVQGRLNKRMRDLKISDPIAYSRYYNANQNVEIGILTSLLTTHHTFFFREFQHFEYLLKSSLPKIVERHRKKGSKIIRFWSAACSRGQEVYSLAMFLSNHLPTLAPEMSFEIIGTDICEESITIANNGVYAWEDLRTVPSTYLQGNWLKGSGEISNYVRANDKIRTGLSFEVLNLQEFNSTSFGLNAPKFDYVFCRNVFIYFNHAQIKKITNELLKVMDPNGNLFVGLSESLNGLGLPIEWVGPSVYGHSSAVTKGTNEKTALVQTLEKIKTTKLDQESGLTTTDAGGSLAVGGVNLLKDDELVRQVPQKAQIIKVLVVDDSPTVTLLMKRILVKSKGFEVVGTAVDGIEAFEKAKVLKPDIITLDIHMPRMSGVEFMAKHFKELEIPVVIVSSVPRDDRSLAFKCLEYGASDYVEKPSLMNLEKSEDELIFKLEVSFDDAQQRKTGKQKLRTIELDADFKKSSQSINPAGKLGVLVCNFSSREVIETLVRTFKGKQPGMLILVEGAGDIFPEWVQKTATQLPGGRSFELKSLNDVKEGTLFFLELEKGLQILEKEGRSFITSCLAVAPFNRQMIDMLTKISVNHLVVEDRGQDNSAALVAKAHMVSPLTSFVYESNRFLSENSKTSTVIKSVEKVTVLDSSKVVREKRGGK